MKKCSPLREQQAKVQSKSKQSSTLCIALLWSLENHLFRQPVTFYSNESEEQDQNQSEAILVNFCFPIEMVRIESSVQWCEFQQDEIVLNTTRSTAEQPELII